MKAGRPPKYPLQVLVAFHFVIAVTEKLEKRVDSISFVKIIFYGVCG